MAKKTRRKAAAKVAKAAKTARKASGAKKKAAAPKGRRKIAAPSKPKAVARKKPAGEKNRKSFLREIEEKVAGAVSAVVDTLTDAERLHHQLDPGISNEPE